MSEPEASPSPAPAPRTKALREARSWPTVVVAVLCLLVGVPAAIVLTPQQPITVAGQHMAVAARVPTPTLSGPAQLVQIGNTHLDIAPFQIWGPLRPQLTLGPVSRNAAAAAALDPKTSGQTEADALSTLEWGFVRWYLWATAGLIAFTLAATALAGYLRTLVILRRHSRVQLSQMSVADIWHRSSGQIRVMVSVSLTLVLLIWALCGYLAYRGAVDGLRNVRSLSQIAGTYYLAPLPEGPPVSGYVGAVVGDSRVSRLGGPLVPKPTSADTACLRSTDSLAEELDGQLGQRVLNLSCPGATIETGLRGPQTQGGQDLAAQIGLLKQVEGLKWVVVSVGPNDLSWTDILRYCYAVSNCQDNLTQGEFDYRLAAFDRDYGALLRDLNDLPDSPQVVILTSYDVFRADADCRDAKAPPPAGGLSPANIDVLLHRNAELNDVLTAGAKKYDFDLASPRLSPLCEPDTDKLGADIQGLDDKYPFHPTGVGMIRMAAGVARVIHPND
jgi:GDSL-like Lipase/Acylhydrolase family